jgi:MFS family permease
MALLAALLGWMFDGFEMGIFPPLARTALIELLDLQEDARLVTEGSDPAVREAAKKRVDSAVGPWNGRIYAAFLVGAALGGWLFGWLGDRIGRVRAMIFSVLTYAGFTGLCGLAQDPYQLAVLRFLAALGMGGEWALGVALVMECWAAHARPVLAGLIGSAANVGFIGAALLVMGLEGLGLKAAGGGWRWMLGACAFPALLTFFIRMFVPESEKWLHAAKTTPKASLAAIFVPGLRRRTIMAAVLGGIALVGTWGSVQWIPQWTNQMAQAQGLSSPQFYSNVAQICSGVGAVIVCFLAAVYGSRIARRPGFFLLCLGSLIVCAVLFNLFRRVDWLFMVMVFVVGGVTASFYGWLPLYLPELFPTRVRAMGQGFGFNFGRIIAAGGALSMGFLMSPHVFNGSYALAGATISLVYLVGLVVIWFAPETHGKPLPE